MNYKQMQDPILYTTKEDKSFLSSLQSRLQNDLTAEESYILLSYPTVYIHYWPGKLINYTDKGGNSQSRQMYNIYIGESNDVIARTKEHYAAGDDKKKWQHKLTHAKHKPEIIIIGHKHFNKSFTLDLENKLIEYMMASSDNVDILYNGRSNPQDVYYPVDEFNDVFHKVWTGLRKMNRDLFLAETEIERSALFKASPLKKLTEEQVDAKERIIAKVFDALGRNKDGQLIIVQGEAGTGKTVLNSSLFYDLKTNGKEYFGKEIDCHLMVNHEQQINVYEQMAARLKLGTDVIHKPTSFINKYEENKKVDVAFIDEGHLLLTQGKQSYRGKNQLEDIIKRAKVTVLMFDEYQILTAEQYWEPEILNKYKTLSINQHNYIILNHQLRMLCSQSTIQWLHDFVIENRISEFNVDDKYEVKSFESPSCLEEAIKEKASDPDNKLSRIVASYDWPYIAGKHNANETCWCVRIGEWSKPWNYEILPTLSKKEKKAIAHQAWAEQEHTINEIGSTFTIQGFDLSYVGVILGPSVTYRDGKIVFDPSKSFSKKATQKKTLSNGTKKSFGATFIRNEVKVLMTRGVKGLYIYACDEELRRALKDVAHI